MNVDVKVIPGARKTAIKEEAGVLRIYLQAPAVDGKANKALIALLKDHYGVRKSQITIIKGLKSRHKTIRIEGI